MWSQATCILLCKAARGNLLEFETCDPGIPGAFNKSLKLKMEIMCPKNFHILLHLILPMILWETAPFASVYGGRNGSTEHLPVSLRQQAGRAHRLKPVISALGRQSKSRAIQWELLSTPSPSLPSINNDKNSSSCYVGMTEFKLWPVDSQPLVLTSMTRAANQARYKQLLLAKDCFQSDRR